MASFALARHSNRHRPSYCSRNIDLRNIPICRIKNRTHISHTSRLIEGVSALVAEPHDDNKIEPFFDLLPRKVTVNQVRQALEHDVNLFTKLPHTPQYRRLLQTRKGLQVYAQMDGFYKMFNNNRIIIVSGETGSGKTTQIPQFIAYSDLPHTKGKIVGCTQPRHASTISAAQRVAIEMDVQLGKEVGYSTRFEDMTTPSTTFLKYLTDDTLLREAINDHDLSQYSTIILDDAHERTLATDLLMSLLKSLCKKRPDLRIVVMSAMPDTIKFQKYFELSKGSTVPLLKISGQAYPVEVFYTQEPEPDYVEAATRTVLMIHRAEEPGDILLFLTGEEVIEEICQKIELEVDDAVNQDPHTFGPLVCIPLHAPPLPQQQKRVFDPPPSARMPDGPPGRKVVVATDIAETSLTIDGIVYVVDPGFSKQNVYNPRIRVESRLVSPISKAAAQQRARHAGRTRPGKCFRLYTERDFISELEDQTPPGILTTNLANVVLTLVKLGVKDLVRYDWIDVPAPESLMRGLELLNYLGALDDDGNLTALGSVMAEFPLDPQLSKTLISSPEFQCSNEILTIVSMLSVPDVWLPLKDQRQGADAATTLLHATDSDHLTLLNVYNSYVQNKGDRNWAQDNSLSAYAFAEVQNTRQGLERIMGRLELALLSTADERKRNINIKKALCSGFFMQVAHKDVTTNTYRTVKDDQIVFLHPSCSMEKQPEWVVFNEFVLTTRPFILTVTDVRPEWLLEIAPLYFDLATKK